MSRCKRHHGGVGIRFYDQLQSYVDMFHSAVQHGYVEDQSEGGKLSAAKDPELMKTFIKDGEYARPTSS